MTNPTQRNIFFVDAYEEELELLRTYRRQLRETDTREEELVYLEEDMENITLSVYDIFELNKQHGEVGIEIEVEGDSLPSEIPYYWRVDNDGSLRGEAAEYVLKNPVKRQTYKKALRHLFKKLKSSTILDTGNAGIHIHLNMQQITIEQVFSFICLYLLFEDPLVRFCGERRAGNLFCLRTKDAEYLIEYLMEMISNRNWYGFRSDYIRYSSINIGALQQYGSLEFRAMRSTLDIDLLSCWIDMLLRLKDSALSFDSITEIPRKFSELEPETFIDYCFGEFGDFLRTGDYITELLENMWRIQGIVYEFDKMQKDTKKKTKKLSKTNPLKF